MEPETTQNQPNQTPNLEVHEKNSMGPLIGSIIVIIILVIGAIYVWGNKINQEVAPEGGVTESELTPLSTNDDISSLETDLINTPDVNIDVENI